MQMCTFVQHAQFDHNVELDIRKDKELNIKLCKGTSGGVLAEPLTLDSLWELHLKHLSSFGKKSMD